MTLTYGFGLCFFLANLLLNVRLRYGYLFISLIIHFSNLM